MSSHQQHKQFLIILKFRFLKKFITVATYDTPH